MRSDATRVFLEGLNVFSGDTDDDDIDDKTMIITAEMMVVKKVETRDGREETKENLSFVSQFQVSRITNFPVLPLPCFLPHLISPLTIINPASQPNQQASH